MGIYCTVRDVRLALTPNGSVDDENQTGASLPDYQIEDAISEAEGIVKMYLASRYTIPTGEVEEINPEDPGETWVNVVAPPPVRGWTRNIAAFLAALTFRKNKDLPEDDPIRLRYKLAMSMLMEVRDRRLDLDLPATITDDDQGVTVVNLYEGTLFGLEDVGLEYDGRTAQRLWPRRIDI